jgi:hypothetical protein
MYVFSLAFFGERLTARQRVDRANRSMWPDYRLFSIILTDTFVNVDHNVFVVPLDSAAVFVR